MTELPQKIGPYRVLQRLGTGGMGEVFLAHDERLDRRVAIKRIRTDSGVGPDQRERFRREARVAARLNHPAIVQIYDILEEGEVDHIVMEYVEGTNLRALAREPLDLPLALRLAREISEGLDSAHREGIVHRDLKTENILVTRSGHAKISDFGIAKQLLTGNEPQLTQGNMVLGTYRAMSPEQARGESVDHRSDLFSLGVLLYEILTGRSPFEAENALATLNRILFHTPAPVRTLRPEVPEEVSLLVGQLLQKDPFLRPRSASQVRWQLDTLLTPGTGAVEAPTLIEPAAPALLPPPTLPVPSGRATPLPGSGAPAPAPTPAPADSALTTVPPRRRRLALLAVVVVVLAGLASTGAWLALRRPGPPVYVGVLEPEIGTGAGAAEVELLAAGVRVALLQGLVGLERISPLSTDEVDAASGPPRQVAKAVSADEVVGARLDCRAESCRVSLNRVRGSDGAVIWAESFEVPTDDYSLVAGAAVRHIQRGYSGFRPRRGSASLAVSGRDFEEFLEIRRRHRAREVSHQEAAARLAEIRRSSPRFLEPYLLGAEVARTRFWASRDRGDLQEGLDLALEAQRLAPDDPRPLFARLDLTLAAQDLDQAEEALAELETLVPGDVRLLERKAWILSARGRPEEALALTRTAAEAQPSSQRLAGLAQMQIQQGRTEEARQSLEQSLRRSPGNYQALSLLAVLELYNGDLHRAVEIYRELMRRSSPGLSQLGNLGLAYFSLGRYQEAAETYRQVVEREPGNPLTLVNLADTYLLMGRTREAGELYEQVLELIAADPATTTPQYLTVKAQALAHLGRGREAVAAVQEALRLAPNDGPVAYEASLVYTLLGETDSALVNVDKALSLGQGTRWFALPWFDPLREDPEFQRLLREASAPAGAPSAS